VIATDDATYRRRLDAIHADPATFAEVNLAGTPAQVVEKLQRLRDLGADRVYLQLVDVRDLEHLELIAAEVLPHLR
jgi:alkanesulfonate monooxygenase SsuD/methylene tetrahydromethanopterin reductase-like flavin-dependent oxidoreductase (luciferase family)